MGSIQAQTYFLERQLSIHRSLNKLRNQSGGGGTNANNRDGDLRRNSSVNSRDGPSPPSRGIANRDGGGGANSASPRLNGRNATSSPRLNGRDGGYRSYPSASNLSSVDLRRNASVNSIELNLRKPLVASSERSYSSLEDAQTSTIRFQVIVWNIGMLDVVTASVPVTFRVTLFWNDPETENEYLCYDDAASTVSSGSVNVWKMHGRAKAFPQEMRDLPQKVIEVPPLAIMNCSTFEVIGTPEVDMLNESARLMRWSCMYRATLVQDSLRVDHFPHDSHDLQIKLGILTHRGKGKQWDRRVWKLALATKDDAQCTTRIPYGLIVDQAQLPGFSFNKERGLEFEFFPLDHGAFDNHAEKTHDQYLRVSLNVLRESGYYDKNIVPLLALLNIVAVSVLTFEDSQFFYRALITLNIAFVAMGMRMTIDARLPSVGYEIRLQRVLNEYFVVLMSLVLEAMVVYVLNGDYDVPPRVTRHLDWVMGIFAVSHNVITMWRYYKSRQRAEQQLAMTGGPMPSIHENYV